MNAVIEQPITIKTDKKESRWVAIDFKNKTLAEAPTPEEVIKLAGVITKDFMLFFVPEKGTTYIL